MGNEPPAGEQLRKGPFQHGRAGRRQQPRAADDRVGLRGRENVGRIEPIVLVALSPLLDLHVPTETPTEDAGA